MLKSEIERHHHIFCQRKCSMPSFMSVLKMVLPRKTVFSQSAPKELNVACKVFRYISFQNILKPFQ